MVLVALLSLSWPWVMLIVATWLLLHKLGFRKARAAAAAPKPRPKYYTAPVKLAEPAATKATGKRYLITGTGMLGSHLIEALLHRGETDILVLDKAPTLWFENVRADPRVRLVVMDLTTASDAELDSATSGRQVVIHTAASVEYWTNLPHQYARIHAINVTGTERLLASAKRSGAEKFLFISSVTAVQPNRDSPEPISEAHAKYAFEYGDEPISHYGVTKALAERAVLAASSDKFFTGAVRFGCIWGQRDGLYLGPSLAVKNELPLISTVKTTQHFIHGQDAVHSLLCLERSLGPGSAANGQAFFISGGPAIRNHDMGTLISRIGGFTCGSTQPLKVLPEFVVQMLSNVNQALAKYTRDRIDLGPEPKRLTPSTVKIARFSFIMDDSKARKLLGYNELFTREERMKQTIEWFKEHGVTA